MHLGTGDPGQPRLLVSVTAEQRAVEVSTVRGEQQTSCMLQRYRSLTNATSLVLLDCSVGFCIIEHDCGEGRPTGCWQPFGLDCAKRLQRLVREITHGSLAIPSLPLFALLIHLLLSENTPLMLTCLTSSLPSQIHCTQWMRRKNLLAHKVLS